MARYLIHSLPVALLTLLAVVLAACNESSSSGEETGKEQPASAQTSNNFRKVEGSIPVQLSGAVLGARAGDTLYLLDAWGQSFRQVAATPLKVGEDGRAAYELSGKIPAKGIYFLGTGADPAKRLEVILQQDSEFDVTLDLNAPYRKSRVSGSEQNANFLAYKARQQQFGTKRQELQQAMQQAYQQRDRQQLQSLQTRMQQLNDRRNAFEDSVAQQGGLIARVARTYSFDRPAQSGNRQQQASEFRQSFLQGFDLSDPSWAYIPSMHGRLQAYAQNLVHSYQLPYDEVVEAARPYLKAVPESSKLHWLLLDAFITGTLQGSQNPRQPANPYKIDLYLHFAGHFRETFPDEPRAKQMKPDFEQYAHLTVGHRPPEIQMNGPGGEQHSLSELRGNVVLIDFWASWCKPCRMENPNLVRTYQKYKDEGFRIFSVSLDRDMQKWKQAIQKDNLSWETHVSDLSHWDSRAAKKYNVRSIPDSYLLDREGKIIAKGLRGEELERKLQEVL